MDLAGKTALVTGAAVRVGRSIALELARGGADVLIHYHRSRAEAEATAGEIAALGRRAATVFADLAEADRSCNRLLAAADATLGRLDILVNNASVYVPGGPDELDAGVLAHLDAVNARTPAVLAERVAHRIVSSRRGGAIVNILDIQALRPWPKYLAYCQSKAALWSATKGLARQFAPAVRVNGVAPGTVLWNDRDDEATRQRVIARVPLGRVGEPEDVARAVRFLCENDYITGQVLCVDGGRTM